jgi:glutathione S-transferase
MRLYTAQASPFGRTVEITAHELGVHDHLVVVPTTVAPTRKNADFQALTPLRRIPALEIEDGTVIVDSTVIARYLAERAGDRHVFAEGSPAHWTVMSRYTVARGISECAVAARYERAVRPEALRWDAWLDDLMDKIGASLASFEARVPTADRPTIVEIALGAALGYLDFRFPDYGWRARFPRLAEWFEPVAARPSFAATIAG